VYLLVSLKLEFLELLLDLSSNIQTAILIDPALTRVNRLVLQSASQADETMRYTLELISEVFDRDRLGSVQVRVLHRRDLLLINGRTLTVEFVFVEQWVLARVSLLV